MKKLFDKMFNKTAPTKDELYLRDIVNSFLEKETNKVFHDPNTDECFITDPEKQVNIMIKSGLIEITNHKFLYKRSLSAVFSDNLIKNVKNRISEDVKNLKKELFKNEIDLLRNILKE
jgi:hypothetical protein